MPIGCRGLSCHQAWKLAIFWAVIEIYDILAMALVALTLYVFLLSTPMKAMKPQKQNSHCHLGSVHALHFQWRCVALGGWRWFPTHGCWVFRLSSHALQPGDKDSSELGSLARWIRTLHLELTRLSTLMFLEWEIRKEFLKCAYAHVNFAYVKFCFHKSVQYVLLSTIIKREAWNS